MQGDKVKRDIFHVNRHVWLSESPKHHTEETHNLYYRDHSSQCPLSGTLAVLAGPLVPPEQMLSETATQLWRFVL